MKAALLADPHFGCRADSQIFLDQHRKFFTDIFFPTLEEREIRFIICLGDLFDRGRTVNFNTLNQVHDFFFSEIQRRDLAFWVIPGNHDLYYRDTLDINAPKEILKNYTGHIEIIDTPGIGSLGGRDIMFLPWVTPGQELELEKADILIGHLDLVGFDMYKGIPNLELGFDPALFSKKYKLVLSGHYHHPSSKGNIHYIGAPIEITWSDFGGPRGFQILDLDDLSLEYIKNPNRVFRKMTYDDTGKTLEQMLKGDFSVFKDICLKVHIKACSDRYILSEFLKKVEENNPFLLTVVESPEDDLTFEESFLDQSQDTVSIISDYVDGVNTSLNKKEIKNAMRDLYLEAEKIAQLSQEI